MIIQTLNFTEHFNQQYFLLYHKLYKSKALQVQKMSLSQLVQFLHVYLKSSGLHVAGLKLSTELSLLGLCCDI